MNQNRTPNRRRIALLTCLLLAASASGLTAEYIGDDPPPPPYDPTPEDTPPPPTDTPTPPPPPPAPTAPPYQGTYCKGCQAEPSNFVPAEGATSLTEGNLQDANSLASVRSGFGPSLPLGLTYNSYNADGSRAQVDSVLGYGWTHSYNVFLFFQRGHAFRFDAAGRVTKYQLGANGTFRAGTGYFETLVRNPDNSFTLTYKDKTVHRFEQVPGTPFLVAGPVWRLVRITDRNNNITTLTYAAGKLTTITDTYGRSLTLAYNAQNKLNRVTDPLGRVTTFAYDATGRRLSQITDPLGKKVTYAYNTRHQITSKKDKDGRLFTYSYQSTKPVSIRDGSGAAWFTLTNPNNWATDANALAINLSRVYLPSTTQQTDGRGSLWRHEYDSRGYLTRQVAPDSAITRYTYDPITLRMDSTTDANNRLTRYEYDSLGNRTKTIDPLNNVTTYTYEPVFSQMTSMTDSSGRMTTHQYDARGNRTREIQAVTLPEERTRTWTYDSHGNVLTHTDWRGFTTQYTYDSNGNRATMTDAVGTPEERTTKYMYDVIGNLREQTDALGRITRYQYDGLDRLIVVTDPLNKQTRYKYDNRGNRIEVIDRNNHITRFAYDLRNRQISTTDALGKIEKYTYDANGNRTTFTDKNNHTTRYDYDVRNRVQKITDALGNMTRFEYDLVGNLRRQIDARNNATEYTYDALNRRVTMLAADGGLTTYEYANVAAPCCSPTLGSGLITKQTDGNGKVTCYKYDNLDRLVRHIRKQADTDCGVEDADDAISRYTYDAGNNRLALTEPNGNTRTYEYDALNRSTKETNAAGDVTRYTYDGVNNLITTTAPNGNVTTNTYDALDRLIQVNDSIGRVASYTYDNVGNRLSRTDGNGNTTTFTYDPINRLIRVIDPLGETTITQYDPVGNVVKVTDRNSNVTTHTYDDINRPISTTDALPATTQFQYDGVGNLVRITDANNHSTLNTYDAINRLIQEQYADPAPNTRTFAYDAVNLIGRTDQKGQTTTYTYNDLYFLLKRTYPVSPADNMTYDLSGRMLTAERGGWLVTYAYDGANRVTQTTQNGRIIGYTYNIPGRTRAVTYPGGRIITEQTDFRRRLSTINDAGSPPPIVHYTYDLGNRVGTRTYRNGVVGTYTYNANNWMLSLEHKLGATRIAGFGYDYDREGNKTFEEKRHDTVRSEAYRYDSIDRLIDYRVGTLAGSTVPLPSTQTAYNLDPVGNWNTKVTDAVVQTRVHNAGNELTKIDAASLLYDDNGNLQQDALYAYAYDEENRLTRVSRTADSAIVGQYQYDALSRRVQKIANPAGVAATTRYFHDAARIVEEQDTSGATLATYVYGTYVDEVLTMSRPGQTYYYHQNTLWSVAALTDSAGNPVERYAYDAYGLAAVTTGVGAPVPPTPWGTPHSPTLNAYLFTGRQFDEETGLYFYRARFYDSVKGRLLQRDPLGYVAGINLYEYVKGNPVNRVDPFGLEDIFITLNLTGDPQDPRQQKTNPAENLYAGDVPDNFTSEDVNKAIKDAVDEAKKNNPGIADKDLVINVALYYHLPQTGFEEKALGGLDKSGVDSISVNACTRDKEPPGPETEKQKKERIKRQKSADDARKKLLDKIADANNGITVTGTLGPDSGNNLQIIDNKGTYSTTGTGPGKGSDSRQGYK